MSQPKYYGLNELREMFLHFFETKGHLRLPSFSLIPQNDASLLLINSGMAPMKPFFTGEQEPPRHRVTTCQKCIRTGDIENIGHTARHGVADCRQCAGGDLLFIVKNRTVQVQCHKADILHFLHSLYRLIVPQNRHDCKPHDIVLE
jgi:hypothetical protein